MKDEDVLQLINDVYDAATDTTLWPRVLESISGMIKGRATMLMSYDARSMRSNIDVGVRMGYMDQEEYNRYYSSQNVWMNRGSHLMRAGTVVVGEMICPTVELIKSEFYNDFLRPCRIQHLIGGTMDRHSQGTSLISSCRGRNPGPFEDRERRLFKTLLPHIKRALEIHRRIAVLEGQLEDAAGALDRIACGCLLLDRSGMVLFKNRAAAKILESGDGLIMSHRFLAAADLRDSRKLGAIIRKTVGEPSVDTGGMALIARPSMKQSYAVLAAPLRNIMLSCEAVQSAAIVFIVDPASEPKGCAELLQDLYGLTAAEARLALILLEGCGLRHASEKLGISLNTVKTQAKVIFEKTNTRRQGELIRLILRSPIFVQAPTNG